MTGSAYALASIIRNCSLLWQFGVRDQLDGVDQVVYCAEGSLAAQTQYPQYFADREQWFTSLSTPKPSSWSQSVIRSLWLLDLYDYVYVPPPPPPPPSDTTYEPPDSCGGSVKC